MTTDVVPTYREIADKADPNTLADLFRLAKLGLTMSPMKITAAALTASDTFDITTAAFKAKITAYVGVALKTGELLPPVGCLLGLRVTASGTANSVGSYVTTDAAGTPVSPTAGANVGLATLSDDGKTIVFPTSVTAFIIYYVPRPSIVMTANSGFIAP